MRRIEEIDALRGVALYGILLVNIFIFNAPIEYYSEFYEAFEGAQAYAVASVVNLAGGKFLFVFAFLFGYGIVLQKKSNPYGFRNIFPKRMIALFVFGALHILLLWSGDILTSYALIGLLAFYTLRWSNRGILFLATFLIFFRSVYYCGVVGLNWPSVTIQTGYSLNEWILGFQKEGYSDVFRFRMTEFAQFIPENFVWYIPKTFGAILFGIYCARKKLVHFIQKRRFKYAIITFSLIAISLVWLMVRPDVFGQFDLQQEPQWRPALIGVNLVFETTLAMGYIIGLTIIFQSSKLVRNPFSKVGRLSLTNYIMQSVICGIIFYGYGLGCYGKLLPTDLIVLATLIYGFNIFFSTSYLERWKSGPLEHIWRKLVKVA